MPTILEDVVERSQRLSTSSQKLYLGRVREFVEFTGQVWTTRTVEAWRDHLLARGVKARTVNLYMAAVAFASKRYSQLGYGEDFARSAERCRVRVARKDNSLTREEVNKLIRACAGVHPSSLRDRAMILVGLHTAFRRRELVGMMFEDIRAHGDVVTIATLAKGEKPHTVDIAGDAVDALATWMTWLNSRGIDDGPVWRALGRTLYERDEVHVGDGLSATGWTHILQARADLAGIAHCNPHRLRHTFTSLALQAGVPQWRIQRVLGHKSIQTMDHYTTDLSATPVSAALPRFK